MIFCISCHVILQFHIILQYLNELKSSLVEDKAIFHLNNEGYDYWWPGDTSNGDMTISLHKIFIVHAGAVYPYYWWIIHAIYINSSLPDKMAAILQTIFSNVFSWMKSFVFW